MKITGLFYGFPGILERGFLGWSSCFLLQTNEGKLNNILFDTAGFNERKVLLERLSQNGLQPEDIDAVVLSHLHFDHAANWMLFPNAEIFLGTKEVEYSKSVKDLATIDFYVDVLEKHDKITFIQGGDLIAGMEVIETPGHTAGMISLKIGDVILASDAIKNRNELKLGPLGNLWDKQIAQQSIDLILEQASVIYPGHDVPLKKANGEWAVMDGFAYEEQLFIADNLKDNRIHLKIHTYEAKKQ